jgi:hypothetical protein
MESSEKHPPEQEPDEATRTPPHGDELFDGEDAEPGDEGAAEE